MYTIWEGREQIVLYGMNKRSWELFKDVMIKVMDDGNTLYEGTYTTNEHTAYTVWTSEHDTEVNIMMAYVEEQDVISDDRVIFDKNFFELFIIHVCRESFNYEPMKDDPWLDDFILIYEKDGQWKHHDFWRIADEISKAWPHPHIDW